MDMTTLEWSDTDKAELAELTRANDALPPDAPRALLSVRLSVFKDETTSPVRQELDLRRMALEKGMRVVGLASDINVSATKIAPWERKSLGDWLNNRVPEFDALLFWKLDRFVRSLSDLGVMIRWAETYKKNIVSKNDPIDLSTPFGKIMVTFIGGIAEIEAANTKMRVESLWEYAKTQDEWIIGKPPYGYKVEKVDGKKTLAIKDGEAEALRVAAELMQTDMSTSAIVASLKERGLMSEGLQHSTLLRRLSNPGLKGYRVETDTSDAYRRSKLVYDKSGKPIPVGPAIFSEDEWDELQEAVKKRLGGPRGPLSQATKFLGVLKCIDCGSNMTVKRTTYLPSEKRRIKETKVYEHLRCQTCKSGGLGAPHPQAIYDQLVKDVLSVLGDMPVEVREYATGEDARKQIKELQDRIAYYMAGLEPGGRFTKTRFTEQQAEETLDAMIAELEAIDPETTEDRWLHTPTGKTFREHWQEGGMDAMAEDLLRAGITCVIQRTKIPGQRAPEVVMKLRIPKDVKERLIVKTDEFGSPV